MRRTIPAAGPRRGFGAPFAALVVGAVAMGASPIFVRLADVGPYASAFWRVALALPALYAWTRLAESGAGPAARFGAATILAGLAFTGDLFFWHLSIVTTSVANATFFATTAPIWVVAFGWLILGERAAGKTLAGLVLCIFGGMALLAQSMHLRPAGAIGDLFGVATGVFFGLYFLAVKAARGQSSAACVTFEATAITAALLFLVALALEPTILPHSLRGVAALLAMAWISHAGGQGLLAVALGRLPAAFSSLVIFLEAIAAASFAYLLLGEPVSLVQALGGLMILAGIYVAGPS
jgi:drug/metabolite transporter (DMT)-like permease